MFVAPACAQQPVARDQSQALLPAKLEIVGNYAGRLIDFKLDGRVILQGRGHLNPPGVSWIETVYAAAPVPLRFEIENCPAFEATLTPGGPAYTLVVQGCDLKLVQ